MLSINHRPQHAVAGTGRRGPRLRKILGGASFALAALMAITLPATAYSGTEESAATNEPEVRFVESDQPSEQAPGSVTAAATYLGGYVVHMYGTNNVHLGFVSIKVYSDGRKVLKACDLRADPSSPAIQIDPTGGGPPDTIVYSDKNGSPAPCFNRTIGYSVRKWRAAVMRRADGAFTNTGGWQWRPLPRPDF